MLENMFILHGIFQRTIPVLIILDKLFAVLITLYKLVIVVKANQLYTYSNSL